MSDIYDTPKQCIIDPDKTVIHNMSLLSIGFDYSEKDDIAALAVCVPNGNDLTLIRMFNGKDAIDMYEQLTGWRINKECSQCDNPAQAEEIVQHHMT